MRLLSHRPFSSLSGWLYAAHGVYLILVGSALAVLSWLIPLLLTKVAESDLVEPSDIPPFARQVVEHRAWLPLLAAPVIAFGLLLTANVRYRWVWIVLGLLSMLLPAGILIYSFVAWIGALYRLQPL
jgi:hypothetical protein